MQTQTHHHDMFHLNGWAALIFILAAGFCLIAMLGFKLTPLAIPLSFPFFFVAKGFRILAPNTALVATLFGKYAGSLTYAGFFWINPLVHTQKISLRTQNYITPTLKVNDASGTPIEIAAAVVFHIDNPAAAVLDVENVYEFLQVQSESALRSFATTHPYNTSEGESLSRHGDELMHEFRQAIQDRAEQAGIYVDEARFTHLAYAPEIASAMLRRQQAQAVVEARQTLVQGAIDMVEDTLQQLQNRNIAQLNDSEKAKLVTSLMTVLLAEENTSPVLNVD
ncbi:MAG: SPFH domain-containing protein [Cardiobacteriaceae bacterium]|nr:SPFH domain-containing protein [Cardiobacteriaceae bacterium]